ncbi:DoxX family membrane protein [Actinacidiphila glaucinigra]|uniref:DoxX family membrane protein n=1 Tax=Actinacidiphila glaucinigra TaxID=235986 RepID=UPI003D8CD212
MFCAVGFRRFSKAAALGTGLLLFRVMTGLLLASHGMQMVSHNMGGEGLDGGVQEFGDDGFRGGVLTALAAGGGQVVGGLLFELGALPYLVAASAEPGGAHRSTTRC